MGRSQILILGIIVLLGLNSCRAINSILHDDEIVAKVGRKYLYKRELTKTIPKNATDEDSLRLSIQYINKWAANELFLDLAEEHLSGAELDVEKELDTYRKQLLKYKYEQLYISNRLDTTVTEKQLEVYYEDNKSKFSLEAPILKARYIKISSSSPYLEILKTKMREQNIHDIALIDSLAYASAEKYTDFSGEWVDIVAFSRNFGVDYFTIMTIAEDNYIEFQDFYGKIHIAYITEFLDKGNIPPIEYYKDRIRDFIISERKHNLSNSLERDLLDDAQDNGNFVIY